MIGLNYVYVAQTCGK